MASCPILLTPLLPDEQFSVQGLKWLHPRLKDLRFLPLTEEEQLQQALLRADKISLQGVQPKLSATLSVARACFDIVDRGGRFILKPNPRPYEDVPANEALTMAMARAVGIETPPHGLIPAIDGKWIYVIKRFDRAGRATRRHVEDFAQLSGASRETKYDSTLEKVAKIVNDYCTFPALERPRLALRLLFAFLTGNEDMHLKNFSLMRHADATVTLSPAYDLLNTTLVLGNATEESALPLNEKKRDLTLKNWTTYLVERLMLSTPQIESLMQRLKDTLATWRTLIDSSYLPREKQQAYQNILTERLQRLFIIHT